MKKIRPDTDEVLCIQDFDDHGYRLFGLNKKLGWHDEPLSSPRQVDLDPEASTEVYNILTWVAILIKDAENGEKDFGYILGDLKTHFTDLQSRLKQRRKIQEKRDKQLKKMRKGYKKREAEENASMAEKTH